MEWLKEGMNYLAHLRLSRPDAESMLGNMMGDFRKHIGEDKLPEKVRLGINNHLRVDRFTDTNCLILDLKGLFSPERRRFAGIIIDVAFDYFLTRHWQKFSDDELDDFINNTYDNISSLWYIMPEPMQHVMKYMIRENWLQSYSTLDGIDNVLNRLSSRIRFENKLVGAVEEVEYNHQKLEEGFLAFFPTLKEYVETHDHLN